METTASTVITRIHPRARARLIDLLAGETNSLMCVGDDAQSIYSWRGADMSLILGFPKRYPGAVVHTIETNYRSVPEILDLSNAAIRANTGRFEKDLRSSREALGVKPALVPLPEPNTQAAFVAQRMLELRDEGIPLEEMAVLYRAHFQSLEIQMELTSHGIPFSITSGLRFFEQAHIKDVAADNPRSYRISMSPAEVGAGILPWDRILPTAYSAGVRHFLVEQEPPFVIPRIEAAARSYLFLSQFKA